VSLFQVNSSFRIPTLNATDSAIPRAVIGKIIAIGPFGSAAKSVKKLMKLITPISIPHFKVVFLVASSMLLNFLEH